jgi:hypothetical protein
MSVVVDWKMRPELVHTVTEMVSLGHSYSSIATEIGNGATRSSIAGICQRLGLKRAAKAPKPTLPKRVHRSSMKTRQPPTKVQPPTGPVIDCPGGCLIWDLNGISDEGARCRWPIGDNPKLPDSFRYCGRQPLGWKKHSECLSPYCEEHTAIAYYPPGRGLTDAE